MSSERAIRRAALAVHRRAQVATTQLFRNVELAAIRQLEPMQIELPTEHHMLVIGDDFLLTDQMRWWGANFGFAVGDQFAVVEINDHSWVAFAHLSERDVAAGVRPLKPPTVAGELPSALAGSSDIVLNDPVSGTVTWNNHLVKKMEVYDAAGNRVGWIPVFTTLP